MKNSKWILRVDLDGGLEEVRVYRASQAEPSGDVRTYHLTDRRIRSVMMALATLMTSGDPYPELQVN